MGRVRESSLAREGLACAQTLHRRSSLSFTLSLQGAFESERQHRGRVDTLAFRSKRGENRDLLVDRVEAEHIYR